MAKTLFELINGTANGAARVQETIVTLYRDVARPLFDSELIQCADQIEARYPTKKVDDKDVNRADRNNRLSILRSQLGRACKVLDIPKLTVKRVEGTWGVLEAASAIAQAVEPETEPQPGDPEHDEALEAVVSRILGGDAPTLAAIREALELLASESERTE